MRLCAAVRTPRTGESQGADRRGPAEVRFDELAEGAKENPKPVAYVSWTWRW